MATAAVKNAEITDIAELGGEMGKIRKDVDGLKAQAEALQAHLTRFAYDRSAIAEAAEGMITKRDLVYAGGGAAIGGGAAYIGSTQGWWELTPLNVGLGIVGGAGLGFAAGRLLKSE